MEKMLIYGFFETMTISAVSAASQYPEQKKS